MNKTADTMNKRPAPFGPDRIILVPHGVWGRPESRLRAKIDNGGIPGRPDFFDVSIYSYDNHVYSH